MKVNVSALICRLLRTTNRINIQLRKQMRYYNVPNVYRSRNESRERSDNIPSLGYNTPEIALFYHTKNVTILALREIK